MPKYDIERTFSFEGVEADDERAAIEKCDEVIGCVMVQHPTTGEDVTSVDRIEEQD